MDTIYMSFENSGTYEPYKLSHTKTICMYIYLHIYLYIYIYIYIYKYI